MTIAHQLNRKMASADRHAGRSGFWTDVGVVLALVAAGIAARMALIDQPNFKPCAAIAIFTALVVRRWWLGAVVVPAMMVISDFWIGGPELVVAAAVQISLLINFGAFRQFVRPALMDGWLPNQGGPMTRSGNLGPGIALLWVIAGSLQFYLFTNLAVWMATGWYPLTASGLSECMIKGLPFLLRTAASDMLFAGLPLAAWLLFAVSPEREAASRSCTG